jgi:hypothetical protein
MKLYSIPRKRKYKRRKGRIVEEIKPFPDTFIKKLHRVCRKYGIKPKVNHIIKYNGHRFVCNVYVPKIKVELKFFSSNPYDATRNTRNAERDKCMDNIGIETWRLDWNELLYYERILKAVDVRLIGSSTPINPEEGEIRSPDNMQYQQPMAIR